MARVRLSLPLLRAYLRRCKAADPRTKVALVLGAAGAPSAYSAGVVDALLEADMPIDLVVGTSGGALNACLYLLGRLTDRPGIAGEAWGRVRLDQVLAPAWLLRAWRRLGQLPGWARAVGRVAFLPCYPVAATLAYAYIRIRVGLFSEAPLRRLIAREIAGALGMQQAGTVACGYALASAWRARADAPDFLVAALDVSSGRDVLFAVAEARTIARLRDSGRDVEPLASWPGGMGARPDLLVPALLASAALYPWLPPQRVAGRWYVDGGFSQALPLVPALEAGATHVLVVEAEPWQRRDSQTAGGLLSFAKCLATAVAMECRCRALRDARAWFSRARVYRLGPTSRPIGALDFDGAVGMTLTHLAAMGHRDAQLGLWWDAGER